MRRIQIAAADGPHALKQAIEFQFIESFGHRAQRLEMFVALLTLEPEGVEWIEDVGHGAAGVQAFAASAPTGTMR